MVYQWLKSRLSHWLPQACILCDQATQATALCEACRRDLPRLSGHTCQQCGLPLGHVADPSRCGHCLTQPPHYDRVISGFAYALPISQMVGKLKFHGQIQLAQLLGELLLGRINSAGSEVQAIMPVPLHARRLRQRGFNQALEIARPISHGLRLPLLTQTIYRQHDTRPQSDQPASHRERNVRGAFRLQRPPGFQRIAIVDDVMTSGHTVNEMAKILRGAGVEQIEVWCVARAWPQRI